MSRRRTPSPLAVVAVVCVAIGAYMVGIHVGGGGNAACLNSAHGDLAAAQQGEVQMLVSKYGQLTSVGRRVVEEEVSNRVRDAHIDKEKAIAEAVEAALATAAAAAAGAAVAPHVEDSRDHTSGGDGKQEKDILLRSEMFVVIVTAPSKMEARQLQRQTWGRWLEQPERLNGTAERPRVLMRYFVGTVGLGDEELAALRAEAEKYNDMVLLDNVVEILQLLGTKLIEAFWWTTQHVECDYVLKTDDDTFLVLPTLLERMKQLPGQEIQPVSARRPLYWGYFIGNGRPHTTGVYPIPTHVICETLTPYAAGGGYILSMVLVEHIVLGRGYWNIYTAEDVNVGMWLGPLNVTRVHDLRFDTEWITRGCTDDMLLRHKPVHPPMTRMYELVEAKRSLCDGVQSIQRTPNSYNWGNPAIRCCGMVRELRGVVKGGAAAYNHSEIYISPN